MNILEEIMDIGERDRRNPGEPRPRGLRGLIGRFFGDGDETDQRHERGNERTHPNQRRREEREPIDFD